MPPAPGRLVTDVVPFDGARRVTVYVPPRAPELLVFAGDGESIAPWGADLDTGGLPSTMVVGLHRLPDETLRIQEYSAGVSSAAFTFDPERFARHEAFFTRGLPAWVHTRFGVSLPAERTVVAGVSAGAEFALAMGVRHPDRYGAVYCASPGAGYQPPVTLAPPLPRFFLVAGREEPFFLENAARWSRALLRAEADVTMLERDGAHGDPFWREEFARMIAVWSRDDAGGHSESMTT